MRHLTESLLYLLPQQPIHDIYHTDLFFLEMLLKNIFQETPLNSFIMISSFSAYLEFIEYNMLKIHGLMRSLVTPVTNYLQEGNFKIGN